MTATDPFDADRLDAWLEGNPVPSTSLNGHSDTQADLVGTAKRFHADAGNAERGLPVPTRDIWEDVMQRTAGLQISPPVVTTTAVDDDRRLPPGTSGRFGTSPPPPPRGLWITTASLVVVAMFAIAAVAYLANRSNDNLSGTSNTPQAPNLAANFSSSPESGSNIPASPVAVDESEWLIDPQKIVCNREFGNWEGTQSSEIPGTINDYLPFEAAPNQVQLDVARTNQAVAGLCFDELDQQAYFADVLWSFPLRPEGIPVTEEQLDIARSISDVINTGDAMDFVHATAAPFQLIQPVVSHSAILPSSVVQLPDGRYAAPLQIVFEANSPEELRLWIDEVGGIVVSRLMVFAPVADGYVIEGYLPICLGNCDGYWDTYEIADATGTPSATIEASPEADDGITLDPEATYVDPGFWLLPEYPSTPEPGEPDGRTLLPALPPNTETPEPAASPAAADIERWLVPSAEIECVTAEMGDGTSTERPTDLQIDPETYLPFSTATSLTQQEVASTATFDMFGCGEPWPLSEDFAWMPGPSVAIPTDEQISAAQDISAALPDQDPANYLIVRHTENAPDEAWPVILPDDVMTLADGRVGAPASWVIPSNEVAASMAEQTDNGTYMWSAFFTFEQVGDDWLLDEMFLVCLGECDGWWEMMVDPSLLPATPEASVVAEATPQPITAEDCRVTGLSAAEVSAIVADPGEEPERSYVPVGPADAAEARAVLEADQTWVACSTYGSIGQRAVLQTPWLTATGPEADPNLYGGTAEEAIAIIEQRRPLSEGMLSDDQFEYVRPSGQTQVEMIESYGSPSMTVPDPGTAYVLEDGRIAIPQIRLEADDSYIFAEEYESIGSYFIVPVHILALDPETQRWLVDEVIWLTGGDVDERIAGVREQEAAMLEQAGMSPATPEATPVGGS